ncbi:hypothetical protein FACS1894152_1840 [Bacilli bacterium]|nr:hypothetical protein FACS1894152_1840 [Bacilli bacterium]
MDKNKNLLISKDKREYFRDSYGGIDFENTVVLLNGEPKGLFDLTKNDLKNGSICVSFHGFRAGGEKELLEKAKSYDPKYNTVIALAWKMPSGLDSVEEAGSDLARLLDDLGRFDRNFKNKTMYVEATSMGNFGASKFIKKQHELGYPLEHTTLVRNAIPISSMRLFTGGRSDLIFRGKLAKKMEGKVRIKNNMVGLVHPVSNTVDFLEKQREATNKWKLKECNKKLEKLKEKPRTNVTAQKIREIVAERRVIEQEIKNEPKFNEETVRKLMKQYPGGTLVEEFMGQGLATTTHKATGAVNIEKIVEVKSAGTRSSMNEGNPFGGASSPSSGVKNPFYGAYATLECKPSDVSPIPPPLQPSTPLPPRTVSALTNTVSADGNIGKNVPLTHVSTNFTEAIGTKSKKENERNIALL